MRRAEIWTVSGGADYTGKPRPAVIIQDDHFDTDSVRPVCPFDDRPDGRSAVPAADRAGSGQRPGRDLSRIMVDKVTTVRRSRLGMKVGALDDASVLRLNRALVVFLGIAGST